jgi:hypothetical protein
LEIKLQFIIIQKGGAIAQFGYEITHALAREFLSDGSKKRFFLLSLYVNAGYEIFVFNVILLAFDSLLVE